jgi:hypothetical protein
MLAGATFAARWPCATEGGRAGQRGGFLAGVGWRGGPIPPKMTSAKKISALR